MPFSYIVKMRLRMTYKYLETEVVNAMSQQLRGSSQNYVSCQYQFPLVARNFHFFRK
jgi:hypothetical protein